MSARRRRSPLPLGVCVATALLAFSSGAGAEPKGERTSSLGWVRLEGAESCIGARALAEAVELRLGRSVFVSAARADVSVEGHVAPAIAPAKWRAQITVAAAEGGQLGSREIASDEPSCHSLDDELALIIAVMIDPNAAVEPSAGLLARAAPPAPVPPAPVPRSQVPPRPAPRPAAGPPWRVGWQATAVASLGLLPTAGLAAEVRGRLLPPGWAVELGGAVWLPADASEGTLGATIRLAEGLAAVCPFRVAARSAEVSTCAGVRAGALWAGGFGFDLSKEQQRPFVSGALEGRISQHLSGAFALVLGLGLRAPFVRDRFYFANDSGGRSAVFQAGALAGTLEAGLAFDVPIRNSSGSRHSSY